MERPYYLTKTSLKRPGTRPDTRNQSDFANANELPFIVLPKGFTLPDGIAWSVGDVALVFWNFTMVAAVVGDKGPRGKLGEGSRELLRELRGNSSSTIDGDESVWTILLPGTADKVLTEWPIDNKKLSKMGAAALAGFGGLKKLKACPGFAPVARTALEPSAQKVRGLLYGGKAGATPIRLVSVVRCRHPAMKTEFYNAGRQKSYVERHFCTT